MHCKRSISAALVLLLCITLTPAVRALDGAPIAENMKLNTYRGIRLEGKLSATDPEGDDIVSYQLATPPVKGEVVIENDGTFVYTPNPRKRGKDYFGYTATDATGAVSQEATVIITLVKQKTDVSYVDMADNGSHYAALRLAEQGIFVGEQICGAYVFSPNTMISRGEFLSLCMKLSNSPVLSGVKRTGYSDDDSIPNWQKPYIATARMTSNALSVTEPNAAFQTTAPITCAQAAVMVDRIFELSKVSTAGFDVCAPDWAAQSVANLIACDVLPQNCDAAQYLNRAMTADLLSNLMDVLARR